MIPKELPQIANISAGLTVAAPKASTGAIAAFSQKLKEVDTQLKKTSELKEKYELGDPNVSLPEVMIESQKAKLAMAMTVELRNKGLEAYRDLINMPV